MKCQICNKTSKYTSHFINWKICKSCEDMEYKTNKEFAEMCGYTDKLFKVYRSLSKINIPEPDIFLKYGRKEYKKPLWKKTTCVNFADKIMLLVHGDLIKKLAGQGKTSKNISLIIGEPLVHVIRFKNNNNIISQTIYATKKEKLMEPEMRANKLFDKFMKLMPLPLG